MAKTTSKQIPVKSIKPQASQLTEHRVARISDKPQGAIRRPVDMEPAKMAFSYSLAPYARIASRSAKVEKPACRIPPKVFATNSHRNVLRAMASEFGSVTTRRKSNNKFLASGKAPEVLFPHVCQVLFDDPKRLAYFLHCQLGRLTLPRRNMNAQVVTQNFGLRSLLEIASSLFAFPWTPITVATEHEHGGGRIRGGFADRRIWD